MQRMTFDGTCDPTATDAATERKIAAIRGILIEREEWTLARESPTWDIATTRNDGFIRKTIISAGIGFAVCLAIIYILS